MSIAEQGLRKAITQALEFMRYDGLPTRSQEARRILQNALVEYDDIKTAEQSEVSSQADTDLNIGQLR